MVLNQEAQAAHKTCVEVHSSSIKAVERSEKTKMSNQVSPPNTLSRFADVAQAAKAKAISLSSALE